MAMDGQPSPSNVFAAFHFAFDSVAEKTISLIPFTLTRQAIGSVVFIVQTASIAVSLFLLLLLLASTTVQ